LFYLPVALVAFTRFGYLMRRTFFRLMLADLNTILEGLTELEEKGVLTIDCRRAQFSAKEPIVRLRVICQSWKVMFQAEYSSGQPLRMLVDLRAAVEQALGRSKPAEGQVQAKSKSGPATKPTVRSTGASKTAPLAAAATAGGSKSSLKAAVSEVAAATSKADVLDSDSDAPEFEISATPGWASEPESQTGKKK
jgi:hypothetical protein